MLYVLKNGSEIDIPENFIYISQVTGMVKVAESAVSESDIARADEAAKSLTNFDKDIVVLSWRRLYFELDNGEQLEWPVGHQSRHLFAEWELTTADLSFAGYLVNDGFIKGVALP